MPWSLLKFHWNSEPSCRYTSESARLSWCALKNRFNYETTISTLNLLNQLVELNMTEGDNISDYISNFETTYNDIFCYYSK